MGEREVAVTGKNRIMIFGPKTDGTYVVEFRTAADETAVIRHFQERMSYGLLVPELDVALRCPPGHSGIGHTMH